MLSIIICSTSPDMLQKVKENIRRTIGTDTYEIISIDNRTEKKPIATVYNQGAKMAKYPYLLFLHEDSCFYTYLWAAPMEQQLSKPDCGVVGFAGCKVRSTGLSQWGQGKKWNVMFYLQNEGRSTRFICSNIQVRQPFEEVITLAGMAMFVRKEVWQEFPFDEKLLTGRHCYDIDFSLQVSSKYKNYVCSRILFEHFSMDEPDQDWLNETVKLQRKKWCKIPPQHTSDISISSAKMKSIEENVSYNMFRWMKKNEIHNKHVQFRSFLKYRMTPQHFFHIVRYICQ